MNTAPAVPSNTSNCVQVTSGMPKLGNPLGTSPSTIEPLAWNVSSNFVGDPR